MPLTRIGLVSAVFSIVLTAGLLISPGYAASPPPHPHGASISCVTSVNPCGHSLSVTLYLNQGDLILVFTSNYVNDCASPTSVSFADSIGDTYSSVVKQSFLFGGCDNAPAYDYQYAAHTSATATAKVTFSVTYGVAPYEADLIVEVVAGGVYFSQYQASCSTGCIQGLTGVAPFTPPSNALVIAYGTAVLPAGDSVPSLALRPGTGYLPEQGPVYPGGYELDSLTEVSYVAGSTTAPMLTLGTPKNPVDGWSEIVVVVTASSTTTTTVTSTTTSTITTSSASTTSSTTTPGGGTQSVPEFPMGLLLVFVLAFPALFLLRRRYVKTT